MGWLNYEDLFYHLIWNIIFKMNQRFQASLKNDPDLMLTISLTNVLIIIVKNENNYIIIISYKWFKDPTFTQWTNKTLCGVPGYPIYGAKTPILNNCSLNAFKNYMNSISSNLPFTFDHAVAIIPPT
jgi:hypothetical protein